MVSFNFSYQPGTTLQQMVGFEIAGRVWSTYLTDPTTLNIHVGTSSLAPTVLGGSIPGFQTGVTHREWDMTGLRTYLQNDVISADDSVASENINSLYHGSGFDQYDSSKQVIDWQWGDGVSVSLTRANAKALGIPVSTTAPLDGYIVMNSSVRNAAGQSIPWNYNYTSTTVPSNTIDFVSVAVHEIGHLLGFVSSVDRPWEVNPVNSELNSFISSITERISEATILDLFRTMEWYDGNGDLWPSLNYSVGGTQFMSLNFETSATALGYFATGKDTSLGGTGYQASHWRGDAGSTGMMSGALGTGKRAKFEERDLRTFDVIGWNRSSATASTALNWSTLQSQAKQALATRIGKTVTWIDANQTLAADLIDQDRLGDVNLMLTNSSDIYEGRANKPTGSFQELFSLLDEQGLFDTMDETNSASARATVRNDLLAGSTTADELSGLRGHDQMIGFKGNDTLRGNKGEDRLLGSLGRDLLIGGKGNDTLIGGAGVDIFAVQHPGLDVVEDFTDGQDKLVLLGGLLFEQLGIQQKGQDTLISDESNSLMLLKNLDATLLSSADIVTSI